MATPLDIVAFQEFQGVFAFVFVLVSVYAMLSMLPFFKEKKFAVAIISFLLGFMALYSTIVVKTINLMAPWLVLFIIFVMILILGFMMTGAKEKDIYDALMSDKFAIGTLMFAILATIFVGSLIHVWTEETGGIEELKGYNESRYSGGKYPTETFFQTLFHPNFLGFVLVLIIAAFTLKYMTE